METKKNYKIEHKVTNKSLNDTGNKSPRITNQTIVENIYKFAT